MAKKRKHAKKSNGKKIGVILFLAILIGGGIYLYFDKDVQEKVKEVVNTPKLKIVDESSKTRPFAVMIDTSDAGRMNHTGLQDAFLTYEVITEGGITRMMALFKDQETSEIGPVRSSRHYFLDYAMENDAIYSHFGWSDRAKGDIEVLDINNLNGITNAANAYWRDENLYAPHNVYTSIEKLKESAKNKDYQMNTDSGLLLNYSVKELSLEAKESSVLANFVQIPYSYYHTTSYAYNKEEKVYYRSINEEAHIDRLTGKQYHVKNIIIAKVDNYSFDDYGRQDLENIGTGDGYFITNGYAIPIKWTKNSRSEKTKYTYLDGTEIKVNDGNTAIQIEPLDENPTMSE